MKTVLSLAVLVFSTQTLAAPFTLDLSHSAVEFSVKHLMVSNVKGKFEKVSGGFDFDTKTNELKDVNMTIEMNSVNTSDKKRDEHLVSPDFFETTQFPAMTFKTTKPVKVVKGKATKVAGELTLKGVTKPVVLDVVYAGEAEFMGMKKVGFTATTKIKRADFGVTWNKTLDKGGVAVGEEVSVTIEGEANAVPEKK